MKVFLTKIKNWKKFQYLKEEPTKELDCDNPKFVSLGDFSKIDSEKISVSQI